MKESRIHRSAQDKFLLGVCGGLAAHWGIRTNYLRAAWVGVTVICMLFPRMVVLPVGLYLVCYLLMGAPEDGERSHSQSTWTDMFANRTTTSARQKRQSGRKIITDVHERDVHEHREDD